MRYTILLFAVALLAACSSKQEEPKQAPPQTEQSGTASGSVSGDVINADQGYIIEGAGLAGEKDDVAVSIKNIVKLKQARTSVVIIRTGGGDGKATEMLALEIRSFAEGTEAAFIAEDGKAAFWVFGMEGKREVMQRTGSIEGSMRLVKMKPAANNMGLNRDVIDGTGDMEIVVKGIDNGGLDIPTEKKYAARYQLPVITLDEFARINQPI